MQACHSTKQKSDAPEFLIEDQKGIRAVVTDWSGFFPKAAQGSS
jgi:hypothetical protein